MSARIANLTVQREKPYAFKHISWQMVGRFGRAGRLLRLMVASTGSRASLCDVAPIPLIVIDTLHLSGHCFVFLRGGSILSRTLCLRGLVAVAELPKSLNLKVAHEH